MNELFAVYLVRRQRFMHIWANFMIHGDGAELLWAHRLCLVLRALYCH